MGGGGHGHGGAGPGGDHDQFGHQLIYPLYAADGVYAFAEPREMWFYKWAVDRGKDFGRKLHNIDDKQLQSIKYKSVRSNTMPMPGSGFWEHKPDSETNLDLVDVDDLEYLMAGKNSQDVKIVDPKDGQIGGFPIHPDSFISDFPPEL